MSSVGTEVGEGVEEAVEVSVVLGVSAVIAVARSLLGRCR